MIKYVSFLLITLFLNSCNTKIVAPDVSSIKVHTKLMRFDKDFFAMDVNNFNTSLDSLQNKYPEFLDEFLYQMLNCNRDSDSIEKQVRLFVENYKPIYDASQAKFSSFKMQQDEIENALKYVHYYFPKYSLPQSIITYVAPIESFASVLTENSICVGLQLYLGDTSIFYNNDYINEIYPQYQQYKFKQEYIVVNSIKNICNDIYPRSNKNEPLIYQMIEAGKLLYMLDKFLPYTADSLKTGYTQYQLNGCFENEGMIWNYFLQNNLLFVTDPQQIKDYMQEGPKTEALGEGSPGFIGQFIGRQIIRKWASNNPEITLPELLGTPSAKIYEEAKYKPK